jgi:predicted alpha-1,2-mannosidase
MRDIQSKLLWIFGACLILVNCTVHEEETEINYTHFVDPFIGTSGTGHTFPGAAYPLSLVQLSPNTGNFDWEYHSGYQYNDSTLRGFAHTHLSGGGNPALGDLLVVPFSTSDPVAGEKVPFSKKEEQASPGYYRTLLHHDGIEVELSATEHTGIHRYTFRQTQKYHILINLDEVLFRAKNKDHSSRVSEAWFEVENDLTVNGYLRSYVKRVDRKVFFSIKLNKSFAGYRFVNDSLRRKLVLDFDAKAGDQMIMRVGISGVSVDGAKLNLLEESAGKSFETIHKEANNAWNLVLSKIEIEGTDKQKVQFYTSMYHLFIQPNIISDVDGQYRGADDSIYTAPEGGMYSTFAFWDTYRAANPMYSILVPGKMEAFVNSVLRHYDEKGYLPVWPLWGQDTKTMIGNHSVPTIVAACLQELPGIDQQKAYTAIKATLTQNSWHKYDWSIYDKYGYLPFDKVSSESVSRTLEATYDDWSAAQLAKMLGEEEDYRCFINRSTYYKNLLDPETRMMRGKDSEGNWRKPFNPVKIEHAGTSNGDYTEGNSWQYTWHVQHDIPGLIDLMGGDVFFINRLDTLFTMHSRIVGEGSTHDVSGHIGQYAHGNEPSQHIAYLYNYAGKPHKTQEMVHKIVNTMYDTTTEGYCGNNDFGQMSAWYVFSTLGFYPVSPASGIYDIGTPAHPYARIKLEGQTFEIIANNLSERNKYVKEVSLNGTPLINYLISHDQIVKGGKLVFEMWKGNDDE